MTDSKALIERLRSGRWLGETTGAKAADHIEKLEADNARLREALREVFEAVCGETGFAQAVRADSGFDYPWPVLDLAEAKARAALQETSHDA